MYTLAIRSASACAISASRSRTPLPGSRRAGGLVLPEGACGTAPLGSGHLPADERVAAVLRPDGDAYVCRSGTNQYKNCYRSSDGSDERPGHSYLFSVVSRSWETVVCQLATVSLVRKTGYVLSPDDTAAQTPRSVTRTGQFRLTDSHEDRSVIAVRRLLRGWALIDPPSGHSLFGAGRVCAGHALPVAFLARQLDAQAMRGSAIRGNPTAGQGRTASSFR